MSHDPRPAFPSTEVADAAHRFFERAGFAGSLKRGFVKYRANFEGPA